MSVSNEDYSDLLRAVHPEEENSPSSISVPSARDSYSDLLSPNGGDDYSDLLGKTSSQSDVFGKSFFDAVLHNPAINVANYLESKYPNVMGILDEGGLDAVYGPGFSSPDTTDQQRRGMIEAKKQSLINDYYQGVDTSDHPITSFIGSLGGALVDPTTMLAPEMKATQVLGRVKDMAVFGAKLGALQGVTDTLAKTGVPTNTSEIADAAATITTDAVVGAIGGAVVQGAIVEPSLKLIGALRGAKASGKGLSPDDVLEAFQEPPRAPDSVPESQWTEQRPFDTVESLTQGTPVTTGSITFDDAVKIADDANRDLQLVKTPEQAREEALAITKQGDSNRSKEMIDYDYKMATGEEPPKVEESVIKNENIPSPFENEVLYTDYDPDVEAAKKLLQDNPDLTVRINMDSIDPIHNPTPEQVLEKIKDGDILLSSPTGKRMMGEKAPEPGAGGGDGNGIDETVKGTSGDPFSSNEDRLWGSKSLTFWQSVYRPVQVWKSLGATGETIASKFNRWTENVRMNHGQFMKSWNDIKAEFKLEKEDFPVIRGLLNNTIEKGTPDQVAAAKAVRERIFNKTLKDYVSQGILTVDQATKMFRESGIKGYFPHVYDKAYMQSKEGQQAFKAALASVNYSTEPAAKRAVESILGQKNILNLNKYVIKNEETGTYTLVPSLYEKLWERSRQVGEAGKSSHIEQSRKFPQELESVLQPFMQQDFEKALSAYSYDVGSRLESAKMWGNNNETYAKLFTQAYKEDPAIALSFKEAFFKEQGDPRSKGVRSFLEAPAWANKTSSMLRALQVFKLTFSGITNLTQTPVNSAAYLSSKIGQGINPLQAMRIWMEGNAKGWAAKMGKTHLLEEAQAFGAAIDHIHADFAGRIADASALGKKLDKVPVIGNIIKDPTTWLDLVRFNATEDIQRLSGYHVGKQYALQLLKNKARLESLGDRANPKKIAKINEALKELGIDPRKTYSTATIADLENGAWMIAKASEDMTKAIGLGAQRVSNIFNFVNDAQEMPHFYNHFMGKMFFQLKRFVYGQGAFTNQYVLKPLRNWNPLPLIIYLSAGIPAGMAVNKIREFIARDDRQKTLTRRVLDAQSNTAAFGIVQSLLESTTYGPKSVISEFVGPGPMMVADLAGSVGKTYNALAYQSKLDLRPVGKEVLRQVSMPASRYIREEFLTPEKDPNQAMFEAWNKGKGPFEGTIFGKKEKEEKAPFQDYLNQ